MGEDLLKPEHQGEAIKTGSLLGKSGELTGLSLLLCQMLLL